jgi:hypothetical protein
METKTPPTVLTLTEIKESYGAETLRFVNSAKADTRGTVYLGAEKVGLIKLGLTAQELADKGEAEIVAVKHPVIGWVFTFRTGVEI